MSALLAALKELPERPECALPPSGLVDVIAEAEAQGLTALLHHHLQGHVRGEQALQLRKSAQAFTARGLRLKRLLHHALDALAAASITPILLKGYGMASRYWPEWHLRPTGDVDVLVRPDELSGGQRALLSRGFVRGGEPHSHHVVFASHAGSVELHFRAFEGPGGGALEGEELFERARNGAIDGRKVRWLPLEEEVVYLASHAAQHLFLRMAWLYDLKLLIKAHPALSWARVNQVARDTSLLAGTHTALSLAVSTVGAAVPADALDALAPTPLHAWVLRQPGMPQYLASGAVGKSRAAPLLRALLADSPLRLLRHLAEGAVRLARRTARRSNRGATS